MEDFLKKTVIKFTLTDNKNFKTYEFTSLPFPSLTAFRADCLARLGIEQGVQCSLSYQAAHGNHEELRTDGCLETFARHAGVAALSDNKKLVTLFVKVQRAAAAAEGSSEGKSTQATLNWAKISGEQGTAAGSPAPGANSASAAAAAAQQAPPSQADLNLLKLCRYILKPSATAAPMDKYRKPAGIGPSVPVAETKQQQQERRDDLKADRKMLDINRDDAVVVQPLPPQERVLRKRKKKVLHDAIDPAWLDLVVPARSSSALMDQLAASKAAIREPEFQNDSEDDEREYQR